MNAVFLFWFRDIYAHQIIDTMEFLRIFYPDLEASFNGRFSPSGALTKVFSDAQRAMANKSALQFIVIIIVVEHFLFLLKYIVEEYIPDIVPWVQRSLIATQFQIEKIALEQKDIEKKDVNEDLKN